MQLDNRNNYISEIKQILESARDRAYTAVKTYMVEAYWLVGWRIVTEEQNGENRAAYGREIIKKLAQELTQTFGKNYSGRTLREFRQFYQMFPDLLIIDEESDENIHSENIRRTPFAVSVNPIWRTVFAKLHWSHYQRVLRVGNQEARNYYLFESAEQNWSVQTLTRNISTLYYQRILSSQKKEIVKAEMEKNTKDFQVKADDFVKNPSVFDFLNLPTNLSYTEPQLEKALIDNLQNFLLELGKGYAFVERQQHIRTETADFYIDLVFYNYLLKCFVIIELKTTGITHQDIGQLDMYVRMYDDLKRTEGDNPTIGILLCTETDKTIAKYSVLNDNKQLFTSKYVDYLPTEAELEAEIEREKEIIRQQLEQ